MLMSHEIEDTVTDKVQNLNNAVLNRSSGAYKSSQKITEKQEDTDAVVLMIAADKLLDAQKYPDDDIFEDTLLYNKSIWTVIQSELTEAHPLPLEIKTNLISLSLFIDNQTDKAIGCRDPKMLDSLININRNIAAGLMHRS
jgi:flagellar protein FlaF